MFPATVERVTASAKAALPNANGRIERAATIVLAGGVHLVGLHEAVVQSQTHEELTYTVNGSCPCKDARYQAKDGWCQHRLAAGMYRRVVQALDAVPTVATDDVLDSVLCLMAMDMDGLPCYAVDAVCKGHGAAKVEPVAQPLPEAPASINVHITVQGRDCLFTLRGTDDAALMVRLEALLARFPKA
jgi:hypothetical protein